MSNDTVVQNGAGDVGILLPSPFVLRIAGEELRLQALPVKRLLAAVQYVQDNSDLLDKLGSLDQADGGGMKLVPFLEGEVYRRLNGLLRLLFDKATAEKMTDDWCAEHLSNAHYMVIFKKVIEQNQLAWLFQRAGEYLGRKLEAALRQTDSQAPLAREKID